MLSSEQNYEECPSLPQDKLATEVDSSNAVGSKNIVGLKPIATNSLCPRPEGRGN
jgi:hypothetical protein